MELDPAMHSKKLHYNSCDTDHTYPKINMVHPLSLSVARYIVGDRFHDGVKTSGHKKKTCKFHRMNLCPELATYKSVTSEVINSKIKTTRLQSSCQQNLYHYFIYNRLMDYWHNQLIVEKQFQTMLSKAKQGETVSRDYMHRFVYVPL